MCRIALTDDSGAWFDSKKAIKFEESTYWDGNNHISRATGSQWEHEALYYTKSGAWVLNAWSQWQGSTESYEQVDEEYATRWLIRQECLDDEAFGELPEATRAKVKAAIAQAEI